MINNNIIKSGSAILLGVILWKFIEKNTRKTYYEKIIVEPEILNEHEFIKKPKGKVDFLADEILKKVMNAKF